MTTNPTTTTLDPRFSSPDAEATPWDVARQQLARAETFWIASVSAAGRPHVTPLMAVVVNDALHFTTGATEQKARNLAMNPHLTMTTGDSSMERGLDVVIEGIAERVTDDDTLRAAAEQYQAKYGWTFEPRGGALHHPDGGEALLFEVKPQKAFGFGKGEPFSQTRWTF